MDHHEAQTLCRELGIMVEGHFVMASGRHCTQYFRKDVLLRHSRESLRLIREINESFQHEPIDVVLSAATGGIAWGFSVALTLSEHHHRDIPFIYARKVDGKLQLNPDDASFLRRKRVLIVEDVITKGTNVNQLTALVNANGGTAIGIGAICNRGQETATSLQVPRLFCVMTLTLPDYPAGPDCPGCRDQLPLDPHLGHTVKPIA